MSKDERELKLLQRRVAVAALALLGVFVIGVLGYHQLGGPEHGWLEAVYMTTIMLTTTGLREVIPTGSVGGMIFTTFILLVGATAAVYTLSMITAFIVEGDLTQGFRRRRMHKRIDAMRGHYVVCGQGEQFTKVRGQLVRRGAPCSGSAAARRWPVAAAEAEMPGVPMLHGDCSDDETLLLAGIDRAAGIVICTDDDKNSLVVTVLARQLNPKVRVVARATTEKAASRLRAAGADGVVSPAQIGGMRLASELVRPSVVSFLDQMLRDTNRNLRIEEVQIAAGSEFAGASVASLKLHEYGSGLLLLAMRTASGEYLFNPAAEAVVEAGSHLIAMGDPASVEALRGKGSG